MKERHIECKRVVEKREFVGVFRTRSHRSATEILDSKTKTRWR